MRRRQRRYDESGLWSGVRGGGRRAKRQTRARLDAAGFRVGNAENFHRLTEPEHRLVDLRLVVSRAGRRAKCKRGKTQQELAAKLRSSQARVAKIEAGAAGISLDLAFRALFATGGRLADAARHSQRAASTGATR